MRKLFPFLLFLSSSLIWLPGCGDDNNNGGGGDNNQPRITVSPTSSNILVGQTATFTANVQNVSDTHVSWSVQETNGGTIVQTNTGAVYTAPWPVGRYHVTVSSVGSPSLTATATINVSAAFAFIEEYPAGDALPHSMTPEVGIYDPDGNFTISGYTDEDTGNPVSVAMEAVQLSADGTIATFDLETESTWDIYTASADGSGDPVQLTIDGYSWYPELSADGQQIVYIHGAEIWAMNVDGTNQHLVFSPDLYAYTATFSPDATKVAGELEWYPGGTYHDGIAIMNADGTNPVALTGGSDFPCAIGWDEMPAFTHDGTQIMFSRYCDDNYTDTLYIINADGTGLTPLLNADPLVIHYNPIPVADKIVFQSNLDLVDAYTVPIPFEIYSMNPDGSALTRLTNNTLFDAFDNWWYPWEISAISQQALRGSTAKGIPHGAGARAAKITRQRENHLRRR